MDPASFVTVSNTPLTYGAFGEWPLGQVVPGEVNVQPSKYGRDVIYQGRLDKQKKCLHAQLFHPCCKVGTGDPLAMERN